MARRPTPCPRLSFNCAISYQCLIPTLEADQSHRLHVLHPIRSAPPSSWPKYSRRRHRAAGATPVPRPGASPHRHPDRQDTDAIPTRYRRAPRSPVLPPVEPAALPQHRRFGRGAAGSFPPIPC
jgi:hypothetical protein